MVKGAVPASPRVYLTGLPDVSKATLNTFFSEYGTVKDVTFKYGSDNKRIKGVGYVLFELEETVKKLLAMKSVTIEDNKVEMKKAIYGDKEHKEEEPMVPIPKEALKCYVCKRDKFPSVEAYLNHKKGKQHQAVLKFFKAKSASVLQLLKAESKLASDRQFDKGWMKRNPKVGRPVCEECQCQINCNPQRHRHSIEHKMVISYNNQKCCDIQYTDRAKYESHLLSLKHLRIVYEKEKKNAEEEGESRLTMKKAIDIYKKCEGDLKDLRETYPELDINADLPPYDKDTPLGINFIVKKINYHCMCCDQKFFAHVNLVEPHCRSYDHYANMADYVMDVEKKVAEKKKNDPLRGKKRPLGANDENVKKKVKAEDENEDKQEDGSTEKPATEKVSKEVKKKVKEEDNEEEKMEEEDGDDQQESKVAEEDQEEVADEEHEEAGDEEQEEMGDEEQEEVADEEHEEVADEEHEEEAAYEDHEEEAAYEEHEEAAYEEQEEGAEENPEEQAEEEAYEEQPEVQEVEGDDDDDIEEVPVEDDEPAEEPAQEVLTVEDSEGDNPVEEPAREEEEEEVMEVEEPKPTRTIRGRRGRGRGRGLKR